MFRMRDSIGINLYVYQCQDDEDYITIELEEEGEENSIRIDVYKFDAKEIIKELVDLT